MAEKKKKSSKNSGSEDVKKSKTERADSTNQPENDSKTKSGSAKPRSRTGPEPKETPKFKNHPYFEQKKRRSEKVKTPERPSTQNPFINILDQHRNHQLRVAKIIAVLMIFIIIAFVVGMFYSNLKSRRKQAKIVANIEKRVALYRDKAKNGSVYERNTSLSKAIATTYVGQLKDWKHKNYWITARKKLFDSVTPVLPKPRKNFILPSLALDMAFIPRGTFRMGRGPSEVNGAAFDELPKHSVRLEYHFWMAKTETTNFQYRIFYPGYGTRRWNDYTFNLPSQPAVFISWHLANEFCEMLTWREKKAGRLPAGYIYRLPTEAEWEYACRAGVNTRFYWGNSFSPNGVKFANVLDKRSARFLDCDTSKDAPARDGHFVTAPVGSFKPNAFGLYDMSGNVWEWCFDWYNPKAYDDLPELNPAQTKPVVIELEILGNFERKRVIETTARIIRGGGCLSPPSDCRSATRDKLIQEKRDMGVGFRVVLAPKIEDLTSSSE
ncbi:MAG: formylglycine-generating enzyme family protein [Kiritimatiellaeota bacterium]|nr:formylglycine-generating enzyme family protein [Kiritimatiellota bacterium]